MMDANLKAQYEAKFGKKPFMGWSDEDLRNKLNITEAASVPDGGEVVAVGVYQDPEANTVTSELLADSQDPEEKARMEEAAIINARAQNAGLPSHNKVPVFVNGAAFGIIDNQYVPWDEAQVIFQKNQVEVEKDLLAELKAAVVKNKEQAEELKNLSNLPPNS